MIAVILASGRLDRLYTALSLLVTAAAEGEAARGLATFARTLVELRETAAELPDCRIWACAAAVETTGLELDGRLDGVLSTPRFLREVADARLVVV